MIVIGLGTVWILDGLEVTIVGAIAAVFITQALVLSTFFGVKDDIVPAYIIAFAFGNLLGPVLLGRLFDSVGRRPMITLCYVLSGCC